MTNDRPQKTPKVRTTRITRNARADMYFALYAVMNPRSLRDLAKITEAAGVRAAVATLERYSKDFNWAERVREFDQQRAAVARDDVITQAIHSDVQHAQLGRALQQMALAEIIRRQRLPADRLESLSGAEVARLAEAGVRIERLASGQATEINEIYVSGWQVIAVQIGQAYIESLDAVHRIYEEALGEHPEVRARAHNAGASVYGDAADRIVDQHFKALGVGNVQVGGPPADE